MDDNIENKSNFLFYSTNKGTTNIQVILDEDTVWATQNSMSEIFDVGENTITYHVSNIYSDGELSRSSTTGYFGSICASDFGQFGASSILVL